MFRKSTTKDYKSKSRVKQSLLLSSIYMYCTHRVHNVEFILISSKYLTHSSDTMTFFSPLIFFCVFTLILAYLYNRKVLIVFLYEKFISFTNSIYEKYELILIFCLNFNPPQFWCLLCEHN